MADKVAAPIFESDNLIEAYEWELTESDTAMPIKVPFNSDKTVQVSGTFGTGGEIRWEGSLDPDAAVWSDLVDPQGNVIAFLSQGIETVLENVVFIRPRVEGGTGVDIVARLIAR